MPVATNHPRFPLVPGIAGGLGPHAHIWLEKRLLELAGQRFGATGDGDFPDWVVSSAPQTPDRTEALLAGGPDPAPFLLASLNRLKDAGADFAAIACNTAHAFLPRLTEAGPLPLPVVHVVVETVDFVRRVHPGVRRIGLLATTGTCRSAIFAAAFAECGIDLACPDDATQEQVMTAIYGPLPGGGKARRAGGIKAGLIDQPDATGRSPRTVLQQAASWLVQRRQVEAVVVACSEISLAVRPGDAPVPVVDTMDVLAEAVLDLASGQRELSSLPGPNKWPRATFSRP